MNRRLFRSRVGSRVGPVGWDETGEVLGSAGILACVDHPEIVGNKQGEPCPKCGNTLKRVEFCPCRHYWISIEAANMAGLKRRPGTGGGMPRFYRVPWP